MSALLCLIAASSVLPRQLTFSDSNRLPAPSAPALEPVRFSPRPLTLTFPSHEPVVRLSSRLTTPTQQRPKAVELSEGYYTRLKIHRYTSYAMVPLFIGQYIVGRKLYNQTGENESLRGLHGALATGMYAGFAVNTVTGGWNLWETRAQPEGRARRYVHSALMLLAGAGFVATGMMAPDDESEGGGGGGGSNSSQATKHRTVAIASMSTALVGGLMMVFWK